MRSFCVCIYVLSATPTFPTSLAQMKDNFSNQIKLGLDLQGGTHLILQVQVQEAIAQETDQTVDRLTSQLRAKNIRYDEVRRVDDTHILVRNVDSEQISQFRDMVQRPIRQRLGQSAPAAGDPQRLHADAASQRGCRHQESDHDAIARNHRAPHQRPGTDRTHHSARMAATTTKFSCSFPAKAIPLAPRPSFRPADNWN